MVISAFAFRPGQGEVEGARHAAQVLVVAEREHRISIDEAANPSV